MVQHGSNPAAAVNVHVVTAGALVMRPHQVQTVKQLVRDEMHQPCLKVTPYAASLGPRAGSSGRAGAPGAPASARGGSAGAAARPTPPAPLLALHVVGAAAVAALTEIAPAPALPDTLRVRAKRLPARSPCPEASRHASAHARAALHAPPAF